MVDYWDYLDENGEFDEDSFDEGILQSLREAPKCEACGQPLIDGECIPCIMECDEIMFKMADEDCDEE